MVFCLECNSETQIQKLGEFNIGTVYEGGAERVWYPDLECGHIGYISTSPIGDVPENAKGLLEDWYNQF